MTETFERTEPVVARTRAELKAARAELGDGGVAVVMTMGALHEGHSALIRRARAHARHVIVTVFLNPLQFGPREDLSRYPRTVDSDMAICRREGVDMVFLPTPDVIWRRQEDQVDAFAPADRHVGIDR
ncbi:MAG TPA: pantoate--beta-alanine ligase, partial [Dermatophilaceae bacterium]